MIDNKTKSIHADVEDQLMRRKSTRDSDHSSQVLSAKNEGIRNVEGQRFPTEMGIHITEQNLINETLYCRVCLQCEEEGNRLIKSCSCRDQIHQQCLIQWIEHRTQTSNYNSSMNCQICKGAYIIEIESAFAFTCEICKQKNEKQWKYFLQSLAVFLLFFGVFVAGIIILIKMQLDEGFSMNVQSRINLPKNTIVAVMVMILVFFGTFTLGLGYKLIFQYCYGARLRIKPNGPHQQAS